MTSSALPAAAFLGLAFILVTEKLTRSNFQSWKSQVLSAIKGAQVYKFIQPGAHPPPEFLEPKAKSSTDDGKPDPPVSNPEYDTWVAKDQQVLSYLLTSLSKEILSQVSTHTTASTAWAAIEGMFASQSRARIIATRMALATASKGSSSISEYIAKMKGLAEDMTSAGKKIEDEELVSYILTGHDLDYDPVISAIAARVEPISVSELFTQLVSHEQRMELRNGGQQTSANLAARGGRGSNNNSCGRGGGGRNTSGRGGRTGPGHGNGGQGQNLFQ